MANILTDLTLYSRPPRLDALGGLAVSRRLIKNAPTSGFRNARQQVLKVRDAALALQEESKLRARTRPESLKPLDVAFDNGWTALRDRIESYLGTSGEKYEPKRKLARKLLAAYFPEGTTFVRLAYEEEWVHSETLLQRFTEEGNRDGVEALAGSDFLDNVVEAHEALGAALGLNDDAPRPKKVASTTGVAEKVALLARAIFDYTRALAGEVQLDDPESVEAFQRAVAPLDAYRARGTGGAPEVTDEDSSPNAPIPVVPPGPSEPETPIRPLEPEKG